MTSFEERGKIWRFKVHNVDEMKRKNISLKVVLR